MFARSVRLPVTVDGSKVAASFKNGLLTVTLPKTDVQGDDHPDRSRVSGGGRLSARPPQAKRQRGAHPTPQQAPDISLLERGDTRDWLRSSRKLLHLHYILPAGDQPCLHPPPGAGIPLLPSLQGSDGNQHVGALTARRRLDEPSQVSWR
jgi:hypothetical protein